MAYEKPARNSRSKKTWVQILQSNIYKRDMKTVQDFLNLSTSKIPSTVPEFMSIYTIKDDKWEKESELSLVQDIFAQIYFHCREFKEGETIADMFDLSEGIYKYSSIVPENYDEMIVVTKKWHETFREQYLTSGGDKNSKDDIINDCKKKFESWISEEIKRVGQFCDECERLNSIFNKFAQVIKDDWEAGLKPTIHKIEKKFQKSSRSRKNYPKHLQQTLNDLAKSVSDSSLVLQPISDKWRTFSTDLENIKATLEKIGEPRCLLPTRKIHLESIKNKWKGLNKLSLELYSLLYYFEIEKE
ncbi:24594_t:CDS:2 [Dentiscutata erythropus]|uniref:24594_t:CDS:1 n=1 Tax=Dentiscutata erythropus TaxID=1348616 RepID=A0A9N9A0A9_9GLOM|nr:24594_t:CDS:2 [Dentiscutata erythropus]